jgi:hypothetical protein
MSSGSRLILHDCDIYFLSAVNYDPKCNRSNFHQGQYLLRARGGGHLHVANFSTYLCFPAHYLLMGLTVQYWQRSLFTREGRGRRLTADFPFSLIFLGTLFILWPYSIIFTEVTIYPERFTALFWIVSKPLLTLGL